MDTRAKREASFLDACGMIAPDGTIDEGDRQAILGQYPFGPLSVTGAAAVATWTALGATLSLGTVLVTGAPAVSTWAALDAAITLGTASVTGAAAVTVWTALDAALTLLSAGWNASPLIRRRRRRRRGGR